MRLQNIKRKLHCKLMERKLGENGPRLKDQEFRNLKKEVEAEKTEILHSVKRVPGAHFNWSG